MIDTVIFDVGGVLVRSAGRENRRRWENKLHLEEWESEEIVFNSQMGTKAQLGQISERELWLWVAERLNLTSEDLEVFRNDFWADDLVDSVLVELIKELRPDYQTAIISNATESLRTNLAKTHEIADVFDLIVCSAEEGVMKPDQEIYLRTLTRLNRPAIDCLFIDDTEENVNAARALGIKTIHFNSDVNMSMEFRNLGVGPGGIK